jgi:hypothetical protein
VLCRTSKLIHPASGMCLRTPLLVPSFSSKAFGFSHDGQPEVRRVLDASREFITKTCLISAYDIYYQYIPSPEYLGITVDLMFLDSGGYEVSEDIDLSVVNKSVHRPKNWDSQKLNDIQSRWPAAIPAVFVSYDHSNERKSVLKQLCSAKEFLHRYPDHLHSFLLKPQNPQELTLETALRALSEHTGDLAEFQLLGVTEKELGFSILERMVRIAKLRQLLDATGLRIPIHVFGSLDPLSVTLYFVAGAEVFDGLAWVRYAYNSGQCVYIQNNAALNFGIEIQSDELRVRTIVDNLRYLEQLESSLRRFDDTRDWKHLSTHREFIQGAAERLKSELGRTK